MEKEMQTEINKTGIRSPVGSDAERVEHRIGQKVYTLIAFLIVLVAIVVFLRVRSKNINNINNSNNSNSGSPYQTSTSSMEKGKLYLSPSNLKVKVGERFDLTIAVSAPSFSIDGVDVILDFDPNFFDIATEKISTGSLFDLYPKNRVDKDKGKIYLTGITLIPRPTPIRSDGVLGKISLRAKKVGMSSFSFEFKADVKSLSTIIENGSSKNLLGKTEGATVEITK